MKDDMFTLLIEGPASDRDYSEHFARFHEFALAFGQERNLKWTHASADVGQSSASYIKFNGAFHRRVIAAEFKKVCYYSFNVCETQNGFLVPVFSISMSKIPPVRLGHFGLSYSASRYDVADEELAHLISWAGSLSLYQYGWGSPSSRMGGDEMTLGGGNNGRLSKEARAKLNAWYDLAQVDRVNVIRDVYPKIYFGMEQIGMLSSAGIVLDDKVFMGRPYQIYDIPSGGVLLSLSDEAIAPFARRLEDAGLLLRL